jgi:hypothetical protein
VRKRWAQATPKQKQEAGARLSRAFWDKLSDEERSAEMKRRARVRQRRRKRSANSAKPRERVRK